MKKSIRRRTSSPYVATAALASLLTGCGGGSSNDNWQALAAASAPSSPSASAGGDKAPAAPNTPPASPQTPDVPSTTDSTPCTNEADFRAGTRKEFTGAITSEGHATISQFVVNIVGQRVPFAGVNPVSVDHPIYDQDGNPTTAISTSYIDLIDGNMIDYGTINVTGTGPATATSTVTFDPPLATPMTMQPGQVADRNVKIHTRTAQAGVDQVLAYSLTYVGRETITTPLGSFDACHFIVTTTTTTLSNGSVAGPSTTESWRAAEGPYRGQLLKSRTKDSIDTEFVVTQMVYSPQ